MPSDKPTLARIRQRAKDYAGSPIRTAAVEHYIAMAAALDDVLREVHFQAQGPFYEDNETEANAAYQDGLTFVARSVRTALSPHIDLGGEHE